MYMNDGNRLMKKISFLIGSLGGGGAERVTVALADYFCENGYEVFFIVFSKANNNYRINPLTGEMKKKQMKFFPDAYKNRIGKSYNDYIADHQMNMFEDFIGYQSSTVLDEPEREAGTTSIPIPQREESENIPSPDLPEQLENVQQSGNEIAERGMQT